MPPNNTIPTYSNKYRNYVLLILTGVYTFNFIDRQILVILQEPIKADLLLSDTQLGLLTGFAFAIFYVTLGIPIARFADKSNRKNIVSIALVVWSGMTAISGFAQNFTHLLLARIGVGVGEAGGSPPSHSIISDYFPPEKRATALSIYSTGVYIGIFLGFLVGGIIGQQYGWRIAFMVLGIPGILYAFLVYFTVKEPLKGMSDKFKTQEDAPSFKEGMKILLSRKTFIFVALGTGFHTFVNYGMGNWFPPFLARMHGMDTMSIGIWMALSAGIGGGIGTFAGGYIADRLRHKDLRWYCWISALSNLLLFIPLGILFFHANTTLVIGTTFLTNFLGALYLGPSIAVTHSLVSAKMRAFASAILFFALNMIGLGFGPLAIGALSDYLTPMYGDEALRWAMTISFGAAFIAMILFYKASQTYRADLERVGR
ncbi:MAG: spinster family MFS transporter [Chitinophagales bacterium]